MANALHRKIENGEVVVVARRYFKDPNLPVQERAFACFCDSFGMYPFTMGSAIYGTYLSDPMLSYKEHQTEHTRIEGEMIDPDETAQWQADNPNERILPKPVSIEDKFKDHKRGWGYFDLFDRYEIHAYETDDGKHIVTAHYRGKWSLIPQTVDTRKEAEIMMENISRMFSGKQQLTEEEEEAWWAQKQEDDKKWVHPRTLSADDTPTHVEPLNGVCVWVNQNWRDAIVLAVVDNKALVEYTMPKGTTALQIIPSKIGGTKHGVPIFTGKGITYSKVSRKWLGAMQSAGTQWERKQQ